MAYSELLAEFCGQRVVDFENARSWAGPAIAYRLREEYDDKVTVADRLNLLLEQTGSDHLTALVIGAWTGANEGDGAEEITKALIDAAPRLPQLKALFFGEITYEECEISWINQADVSPLLKAYPRLEVFRVRGGTGLSFSKFHHASLREIGIETGGLSRKTIRELLLCDFPALEHLELLLGEANYGFDATVEDFQPLFAGGLFPRLKFLGLMNSEIANDLAAVLVNSPIVDRIEELDLSMGNLDDEGVQSLHGLQQCATLKRLNVSHYFASQDAVAALAAVLPFELVADDRQEPGDEWRPIVHAE
jgi:hypothetical protein